MRGDFLSYAISRDVVQFGDFVLKSGRRSPVFFDVGRLCSGKDLDELAAYYTKAIQKTAENFDVVFGTAYKAIPIAAAVCLRLYQASGEVYPLCYNRKEAKAYGDAGVIVGPLKGRVLVLDDVLTAGTALRETIGLIGAEGATVETVVVAIDRQEKGRSGSLARSELEAEFGCRITALTSMTEILDHLRDEKDLAESCRRLEAYLTSYGV